MRLPHYFVTTKNIMAEKRYYEDINYIRIIMILSVVVVHSFTPFGGGWPLPQGYPRINAYAEIVRYTASFNMEMFVFISGFLFGFKAFRLNQKGETFDFKSVMWNKTKRILFPSVVFSLIYALVFPDKVQPIMHLLYRVISGAGHLWFLPMIFTCFFVFVLLEKFKVKQWIVLPVLFFCAILPHRELFFQLGRTSYFMFFFYMGYALRRYDVRFVERFYNLKSIVGSLAIYLFFYTYLNRHVFGTLLKQNITITQNLETWAWQNVIHVCYAFFGVLFFYLLVNYLLEKNIIKPSPVAKTIGVYCFGIFIFQQFVLKLLYYDTPLHSYVSPYLFPWIGLASAIAISFVLTYVCMKTKIGKILLAG